MQPISLPAPARPAAARATRQVPRSFRRCLRAQPSFGTVSSRRCGRGRAGARRSGHRTTTTCKEGGMYVPSDSFNGMSPERKAAQAMVALFTFIAARVVLAQLEGSGRSSLGSYNVKASQALREHLTDVPLRDADAWLEGLMRKDELLGVRLMEVRAAYARGDFEWHQMEQLAVRELEAQNTALMRSHATRAFRQAFAADASSSGGS